MNKQKQRVLSRFCADCGEPNPSWASINFGALVCLDCSGAHRSFGTHITKVRSIKLDYWTDDLMFEFLAHGGNDKVNALYEHKIINGEEAGMSL